jgi:hypothetical protein
VHAVRRSAHTRTNMNARQKGGHESASGRESGRERAGERPCPCAPCVSRMLLMSASTEAKSSSASAMARGAKVVYSITQCNPTDQRR